MQVDSFFSILFEKLEISSNKIVEMKKKKRFILCASF